MAGANISKPQTTAPGSDVRQLVVQHNKLVDDVELLRSKLAAVLTKLDSDAGVTDTNYNALHAPAAATLTASKLANPAGVAITT
jgi:hypothetical protein